DIQERLKNLGYEVTAVAHSGEEALASVASTQPDLVLMDIRLKGNMDGIDAARVIRERFNLPVVYLTGEAGGATLERAKATEPLDSLVPQALREGVVAGPTNRAVLISRQGAETPIDESAAPIRDNAGNVTGVVLTFRDVSEHQRARQALQESEERFRVLVEGVQDYAIFM